ncbi:MAG: NfeD family protein [Gammaproteobacteria bacterium]|nr:NfeD family protein [Gammaproteobacteria bacterium]
MNLVIPVRFSRGWWFAIGATTLIVGAAAFLVLRFGAGLGPGQLVLYWLIITFAGDVITAISMEAVAPTRVTIGPGDRQFDADHLAELAVVLVGFDDAGQGRVRIRGETWRARQAEDDRVSLKSGTEVRVVARDGLTLVVAADNR